jgi:hypothetical protein
MMMVTGRWLGWLLVVVAVGATACGGDGAAPATDGGERAAVTAPATVATDNRPLVEEQLAILDGRRDPAAYAVVLDCLAAKCREARTDVAEAIVAARRTLVQERGVTADAPRAVFGRIALHDFYRVRVGGSACGGGQLRRRGQGRGRLDAEGGELFGDRPHLGVRLAHGGRVVVFHRPDEGDPRAHERLVRRALLRGGRPSNSHAAPRARTAPAQ